MLIGDLLQIEAIEHKECFCKIALFGAGDRSYQKKKIRKKERGNSVLFYHT